jgi:hypothetical protein
MEAFFIRIFWFTVALLWVALLILYFLLTSRRSLQEKGHSEAYISYLRRSHTIRIISIAIVLPLLMLLSAWIISLLTGALNREAQLGYIVLLLILLVSPFKYLDERFNQRRIRELALENREKVAVDLNFQVLHQIYNPFWELILGPLAFLYGFFFLRIEQWIIYLFLLFPWFMYLTLRGTRYQTRPYLKDNYKYTFSFNIFNFLFFLLYFVMYFILKAREVIALSSGWLSYLLLFAGLVIILALTIRTMVYLASYRAFNRAISGEKDAAETPFRRKLAFSLSGVVLLVAVMGTVMLSGIAERRSTEVGRIHQKFILQDQGDHCDTLLVIDKYFSANETTYADYFRIKDLKLSCKVILSRTEQVKNYEVCCPSIFQELPVGEIVKFECGSGPSIIRIVDE